MGVPAGGCWDGSGRGGGHELLGVGLVIAAAVFSKEFGVGLGACVKAGEWFTVVSWGQSHVCDHRFFECAWGWMDDAAVCSQEFGVGLGACAQAPGLQVGF